MTTAIHSPAVDSPAVDSPAEARTDLGAVVFRHRAALLVPAAAAVVAWASLGPAAPSSAGAARATDAVAALGLVAPAVALRLWTLRAIGKRARVRRAGAKVLLRQGPFRHVRNPIYLANAGVASGLALLASGSPWSLAVPAWILAVYALVVRHEERVLAATFGADYAAFRAEVPRWLPRWRPAASCGAAEPWPWRHVLRREVGLVVGVPLAVAAIVLARSGAFPLDALLSALGLREAGARLTAIAAVAAAITVANVARTELALRRHERDRAAFAPGAAAPTPASTAAPADA